MGNEMLKPTDCTLLAVAAAGGQGLSPAQLQRSLFVVGKQKAVGAGFYRFQPYNYGPFCVKIYQDAEALATDGFIEIVNQGLTWARRYQITSLGAARAEHLRESAPRETVAYLDRVVA